MGPTLKTSKLVSYITPLDKSIENRDVERDTPPPLPPTAVATSFPLTPPKLSPLELAARSDPHRVDSPVVVSHLPLETPPESPECPDAEDQGGTKEEADGTEKHDEKADEEDEDEGAVAEGESEDVAEPEEEMICVTPPMMDHEYCLSPQPSSSRSSLASTPQPPPPVSTRLSPPPMGGDASAPLRSVTAGLRNRGLYCYMNSIIQCLANIPKMKKWFLEAVLTPHAPLAMEYQKLFKLLWTSAPFVDPHPFVEALPAFDFPFTKNKQHDSSEFLVWFLNALHQDLARKKDGDRRSVTTSLKTSQVKAGLEEPGGAVCVHEHHDLTCMPHPSHLFIPKVVDGNNNKGELLAKKFWESQLLKNGRSIITDLFSGQSRSTVC